VSYKDAPRRLATLFTMNEVDRREQAQLSRRLLAGEVHYREARWWAQ
jgi:hypothetical protein